MLKSAHTFSINSKINPATKQPFGSNYAGEFSIRRPTLFDKKEISIKEAADMSKHGHINPELIGDGTRLINYVMHYTTQIATAPLPEWFDLAQLHDNNDEEAILSVWEEVEAFFATFRPAADRSAGVSGTGQPAPMVPQEI